MLGKKCITGTGLSSSTYVLSPTSVIIRHVKYIHSSITPT